jgi:serine/threonine protein kinase
MIPCPPGSRARNAEREYRILKQLQHPYILAYADFEYNEECRISLLYTKFCTNGDLGLFLPKRRKAGQFTENYAWDVAQQISSALIYLHYGVTILVDKDGSFSNLELAESIGENRHQIYLHRDVKPENSRSHQAMSSPKLRCPVFIQQLYPNHIKVQLGVLALRRSLVKSYLTHT